MTVTSHQGHPFNGSGWLRTPKVLPEEEPLGPNDLSALGPKGTCSDCQLFPVSPTPNRLCLPARAPLSLSTAAVQEGGGGGAGPLTSLKVLSSCCSLGTWSCRRAQSPPSRCPHRVAQAHSRLPVLKRPQLEGAVRRS